MRKNEFINEIRGALRGYPHDEVENSIEFYSEIIDDRMENGMSEEQAVASLGDLDRIIKNIKVDMPLKSVIRERVKENKDHPPHPRCSALGPACHYSLRPLLRLLHALVGLRHRHLRRQHCLSSMFSRRRRRRGHQLHRWQPRNRNRLDRRRNRRPWPCHLPLHGWNGRGQSQLQLNRQLP